MPKPLGKFGGEEPFITGVAGGTGAGSKEGGAGSGGSFGSSSGGPVTKAIEAARESQDSSPEGGLSLQQATTFYITPHGNMSTPSGNLVINPTTVSFVFRFVAVYTITFTKIAFEIMIGNGNLGVAVYEDSDSGVRLATSGAHTGVGVKSVTGLSPVTLIAGRTYRALVTGDTLNDAIKSVGSSENALFLTFGVKKGRGTVGASGVPPATTGALTASGDVQPFALVLSSE